MSDELDLDGGYGYGEDDDYSYRCRDDEDDDGLCKCGLKTVGERCSECGEILCPMCSEVRGGFCRKCPTTAYPEIYAQRMSEEASE